MKKILVIAPVVIFSFVLSASSGAAEDSAHAALEAPSESTSDPAPKPRLEISPNRGVNLSFEKQQIRALTAKINTLQDENEQLRFALKGSPSTIMTPREKDLIEQTESLSAEITTLK